MTEKLIVLFSVNNFQLGIDIFQVKEIVRMVSIDKIPRQPAFIEGVINFRGEFTPVIDLRKRFLFKGYQEWNSNSRIIIVYYNERKLGLIVDEVHSVEKKEVHYNLDIYVDKLFIKEHFVESVCENENGIVVNIKIDELFSDVEADLLEPMLE